MSTRVHTAGLQNMTFRTADRTKLVEMYGEEFDDESIDTVLVLEDKGNGEAWVIVTQYPVTAEWIAAELSRIQDTDR